MGQTKGVIAQAYATSERAAERAVNAMFVDTFGEDAQAVVIDVDAAPGLWIEGNPAYIRSRITA
jgi:hypothetical protein